MGQKTSKIISSNDNYFNNDINNLEQYADGKGICEWNDNVYNGCFKNNAFNGKGVCIYNDESYYDGFFKDNMKHGKGILYYNDGTKYIGNFENDYCNGKGKYIYESGDYYLGDFSLDNITGKGKLFDADNRLIYDGEWLFGAFHGYGIYYNFNGTISYEGLWINSMAHGRGKFYNKEGDLEFDGYFYEGEPNIKFKDSILVVNETSTNIPNSSKKDQINLDFYNNQKSRYHNLINVENRSINVISANSTNASDDKDIPVAKIVNEINY